MQNEYPVRKNIRLKSYDYNNAGLYFITICIKDGHRLLWKKYSDVEAHNDASTKLTLHPLSETEMGAHNSTEEQPALCLLSETGEIVKSAIEKIPLIYKNIAIDKYVIMPNHIHMIIRIIIDRRTSCDGDGRTLCAPTVDLSRVIKLCKEAVTKKTCTSIWQKSFYDHIIRGEDEYLQIWRYIDENPARWSEDKYYTQV